MSLLDGRLLPQTVIVFVVIGILALVLRWAYGRDRRAKATWPEAHGEADPVTTGNDDTDATEAARAEDETDFGLLAPAAIVDTAEEAQRVRALLAEAGIRATTRLSKDGRHRVLVFESELRRARRISDHG